MEHTRDTKTIRNISIIAHVDHGKSTLADRILEYTGAVEKRHLSDRMLDRMDLEQERGITIKMQPVCVRYRRGDTTYTLNFIDTPGHIDFSYEVSRSLRAVEGVLLLVDATQGIQAQTVTVLTMARDCSLTVIPVLSKIDMPHARVDAVSREVADLLGCSQDAVQLVSGRTGEGVGDLLGALVDRCPPPSADDNSRALVFDFSYTNHGGITAYARMYGGSLKTSDRLVLRGVGAPFSLKGAGVCTPEIVETGELGDGMIGYLKTGIREPGIAVVGDTVTRVGSAVPVFPGYRSVSPVIWASLYPQQSDSYDALGSALQRLRLSDAALTYEEERSMALGKGFRCGFLGMLHLEIITERLRREAHLELVITAPSTDFTVTDLQGSVQTIATPAKFPDRHAVRSVTEPWVAVRIITPSEYVAAVSRLCTQHEGVVIGVEDFGDNRCSITGEMPLRTIMRRFFDRLKSASSGYASLSYERVGNRPSDVLRLDILLAEEVFPAFSEVVSRKSGEREAREIVEILHDAIPRALFVVKIQARLDGRIVASKTLPALRKDVTAKLYGGDITRKMKLREKQKKGKQKMRLHGRVGVSHETFLKVLRKRSG